MGLRKVLKKEHQAAPGIETVMHKLVYWDKNWPIVKMRLGGFIRSCNSMVSVWTASWKTSTKLKPKNNEQRLIKEWNISKTSPINKKNKTPKWKNKEGISRHWESISTSWKKRILRWNKNSKQSKENKNKGSLIKRNRKERINANWMRQAGICKRWWNRKQNKR